MWFVLVRSHTKSSADENASRETVILVCNRVVMSYVSLCLRNASFESARGLLINRKLVKLNQLDVQLRNPTRARFE